MPSKFAYQYAVLVNAAVADISRVKQDCFSITRHPCLLPGAENEGGLWTVLRINFQSTRSQNFKSITDDTIDRAWHATSLMTETNGCLRYHKLATVMLSILVLVHSNAECKRIFSIVHKKKLELRASLSTKV